MLGGFYDGGGAGEGRRKTGGENGAGRWVIDRSCLFQSSEIFLHEEGFVKMKLIVSVVYNTVGGAAAYC